MILLLGVRAIISGNSSGESPRTALAGAAMRLSAARLNAARAPRPLPFCDRS